jgi:hypothetical protein
LAGISSSVGYALKKNNNIKLLFEDKKEAKKNYNQNYSR